MERCAKQCTLTLQITLLHISDINKNNLQKNTAFTEKFRGTLFAKYLLKQKYTIGDVYMWWAKMMMPDIEFVRFYGTYEHIVIRFKSIAQGYAW